MHVNEAIGWLQTANSDTQAAMSLLYQAKELAEQAKSNIEIVRNVSVDSIGAPALATMIEFIEKALVQGPKVIESNNAYIQTL